MKEKEHLSLFGIGPGYGIIIVSLTLLGTALVRLGKLESGQVELLHIPFFILGIGILVLGIVIWASACFQSRIDEHIRNNTLVTTGVYAHVRNPLYTAVTFVCIGVLLMNANYWLLILPFVYWGILTFLLKHTEEKWLSKLYGKQYQNYCKHVNRCIPRI